MNLSPETLQENYDKLIQVIEDNFTGERKTKLKQLYDSLAERIATAPASAVKGFHGAYVGGYVVHVLKVVELAKGLYTMMSDSGGNMTGYSEEELIFSALNHDLGKIGTIEHENYLPNPSEWHVKKQGKVYTPNPEIDHMPHCDRSLMMLQKFGIEVSDQEWIAIRTHDGAYTPINDVYLKTWNPEQKPKTNLNLILHQADMMACRIEFETEKDAGEYDKEPSFNSQSATRKKAALSSASQNAQKMFDDIFNTDKKD